MYNGIENIKTRLLIAVIRRESCRNIHAGNAGQRVTGALFTL